MSIYGFRGGPTYRPQTKESFWSAALAEPMNPVATFFDQAKGGVLESFGLGTAVRDVAVPKGNATDGASFSDIAMAGATGFPVLGQAYLGIRTAVQLAINPPQPPMTESAYKTSEFFRTDVPWDAAMTETRAAALADWYDAKKVREFYAEKQPIAAFLGNLTGQALDPINYVPVAGPAVKAAAVAKFGTIAGHVAAGALDAAANTAIFGAATAPARRQYGDDVSWQTIVSEVAMAALIGGAFGGAGGILTKRAEGKAVQLRQVAQDRLSTLKTTQESRIALNEAVDGLANEGDIRLSPNATDPIARVNEEVAAISQAYDTVHIEPTGPVNDPIVKILPDDIEGTIVARGAFKDVNELEFSKRGWGLVKVIWRHGEESGQPPEFQVSKNDVVALPSVIREYEPSAVSADGTKREWRVERDGRTIVYADSVIDGERHVVTTYVQNPNAPGAEAPKSAKRKPVAAGSSSESVKPVGDTAQETLPSSQGGQQQPAQRNIGQARAVDNTQAKPTPQPDGYKAAKAGASTPEQAKAMAETYRVNPATGAFLEEPEIAQIEAEGRLTEEDRAEMDQATTDFENGAAYGEALKAAVGCLI